MSLICPKGILSALKRAFTAGKSRKGGACAAEELAEGRILLRKKDGSSCTMDNADSDRRADPARNLLCVVPSEGQKNKAAGSRAAPRRLNAAR